MPWLSLLSIAGKAGGWAVGLLAKVPAIAWLVIALACWGFWGAHQAQQVRAEKAQAVLTASQAQTRASELARAKEQALNKTNLEISDALSSASLARATAARSAAERLRLLAKARADSAALSDALDACRSYAGPAVAVIPDAVREALVELGTDADQITAQLRGCQSYVRSVLNPQPNPKE